MCTWGTCPTRRCLDQLRWSRVRLVMDRCAGAILRRFHSVWSLAGSTFATEEGWTDGRIATKPLWRLMDASVIGWIIPAPRSVGPQWLKDRRVWSVSLAGCCRPKSASRALSSIARAGPKFTCARPLLTPEIAVLGGGMPTVGCTTIGLCGSRPAGNLHEQDEVKSMSRRL